MGTGREPLNMFLVADNLWLNEAERILQDLLLDLWILDDALRHGFDELRHDLSADHKTTGILIDNSIYEGVEVWQEGGTGFVCEEVVEDGDIGRALVPLG